MNQFILHIEDSEVDHELFKRAIPDVPMIWFRTTAEGYSHLEKSEEHEYPAVIVVDLNLPAENGIKLIERIKLNNKYKKIPVIVLSSITDGKEINNCYLAGANAFLQKTLRPNEVTSKLEAMVNFFFHSATLPNQEGER